MSVLALLAGCQGESRVTLAAQLADPKTAAPAACDLLWQEDGSTWRTYCTARGGYGVRAVIPADRSEDAVSIVFLDAPFSHHESLRADQGPFYLFDHAGRGIPVFANANVLDSNGAVVPFHRDGRRAVIQSWVAGRRGTDWTAERLVVTPLTTAQKPALDILLGGNHPVYHPTRHWRADHFDENGFLEVEVAFGDPDASTHWLTYHYSVDDGRYVGPPAPGSVAAAVLRPGASVDAAMSALCVPGRCQP